MLQFYFLSIVLNALAGFILISKDEKIRLEFNSSFTLKDDTFRLLVGILSAVTGLLKILSVVEGDIPVIGDLVPALLGFLTGFILIFEHYRSHPVSEDSDQSDKISMILINKRIIGIAALVAAALHFLFPKVLLL